MKHANVCFETTSTILFIVLPVSQLDNQEILAQIKLTNILFVIPILFMDQEAKLLYPERPRRSGKLAKHYIPAQLLVQKNCKIPALCSVLIAVYEM